MVDKSQTNANLSLIEVYRANIANPETLEALRFWISNELVKIQSSFFSAEDVLRRLNTLIAEIEAGTGETGATGVTGPRGAQGVQGETGPPGADGADADPSALIADGERRTDKTWSSSKISMELAGKMGLHEYMQWLPGKTDQFEYPVWSVVVGGGYIAIANRRTLAYPFPTKVGNEASLYIPAPSWSSTPTHTGHVRSGYTVTITNPVEIKGVEVWAPEVTADNHYTLVVTKAPGGSNALVRRIPLDNDDLTAGVWSSVAIDSIIAVTGDEWLFYLEVQKYSATSAVSGEYIYTYADADWYIETAPDTGRFTTNRSFRGLRLNETDNLAATPALTTLVIGSTITLTVDADNYISWIALSAPVDKGAFVEWSDVRVIDACGKINTLDVCTLAGEIPTSLSQQYVALTTHWSTPPTWGTFAAFLEHDGVDQVPTSTTGYGVNLTAQQLFQSSDWDLIPLGGAATDAAAVGGGVQVTVWKFDTGTVTNPSNGDLRLNTAAFNTATFLYVDYINDGGVDVGTALAQWAVGDKVYLQEESDSTRAVLYTISSVSQDVPNTCFTFGITWVANGAGAFFANNEKLLVARQAPANATHTGEVTGSGVLTLDPTAISNRSVVAIDRAADYILFYDASGAALAKALGSTMDLVNDTTPELGGDLDALEHNIVNVKTIDLSGQTAAYTSAGSPYLGILDNHSYNFAGVSLSPAVRFSGTHTILQSGFVFGMGYLFGATGTFKNDASVNVNLTTFYTLVSTNTYQADSQSTTFTTQVDVYMNPTFNAIGGGGALALTGYTSYAANGGVGAGCTATSRHGFSAWEFGATGGGTLNRQAGVSIADLATATYDVDFLYGTLTIPTTGNYGIYQGDTKVNRWNGGQQWKTTVSSSTSLTATAAANHYYALSSTSTVTLTLPDATTCLGLEIVVKKTGASGTINITSVSSQTFDGAASPLALSTQWHVARIISDGVNWLILHTGAP